MAQEWKPGSDGATPGRGDPLELLRRIRGAEPGAAGNLARLERERASVFCAYNSGSCLLVNRPPLGAQSEGGGIDSPSGALSKGEKGGVTVGVADAAEREGRERAKRPPRRAASDSTREG